MNQPIRPTVTFVIPAFNEEDCVFPTIRSIPVSRLKELGFDTEILIIDNNSTDRTREIALQHGARVIPAPIQGYGAAYKVGFESAKGQILICGDCDCTYPFNHSDELLALMENNHLDLVLTNRFSKGYFSLKEMSLINRFGNLILTTEANLLFNIHIQDIMSGMWLVKKSAIKNVDTFANGMSFSHEFKIELTHFLKCRWQEVPIKYQNRTGKSKLKILLDGTLCLINIFLHRLS